MKAHQLYKQCDRMSGIAAISSGNLSFTTLTGTGWEYLEIMPNGQTYQALTNRQYIDLAGWTAQDLTMFTVGVDIQKDGIPLVTTMPCPLITVYDFITTRRISDDELIATINSPPGFLESTLDLMQCTYGLRQSLAQNAQIPGTFINVDGGTFGSGNPSSSDKLHWTRLVITTMAKAEDVTGAIAIPPTNLVIQATTTEEADLVYMERLRRSYVLQGEL